MSFVSEIYRKLFRPPKKHFRVSKEAQEKTPTKLSKKELLEIYNSCAPLNRAIVIRATFVSNFLKINGNEKEINRILSTLSPTSGMAKLRKIIFNASVQADIYGAGFVEVHLDEKMNPNLSIIHSGSVDYKRDPMGKIIYKNNKIKSIIQEINYDQIEIPLTNIATLKYNEIGDEPYGTSLVQNLSAQAKGYIDTLDGFGNAINHLGFPIYDFSVGDNEHEPTPEIVENLQETVKNFGKDTKEFVHEHYIKPSVTESKYMSQSVDFDKPFIRAIAIGTGIPESLLAGDAKALSLAAARVLEELLPSILVPSMRNNIEVFVEDIFQKLSGKENAFDINVSFEPIFRADADAITKSQILAAQRTKILSEIPDLCTKPELREIAGLTKT